MSLAGSQFKSFAAFKIGRVKIQNFTMPTPEEELDLQEQLATCMLNKSWLFTCISLIVSIPLSLRSKTYNPVVYCGLSGTMLDLLNGKLLQIQPSNLLFSNFQTSNFPPTHLTVFHPPSQDIPSAQSSG